MVAGVVVVVAILALAGGVLVGKSVYGSSSSSATSFLVVGTNVPFPPFEDYNATSNSYFGFDIDLAQMVATAAHDTLIIRNFADFTILLSTVGTGGVDMAASAITLSGTVGADRNQTMSFSDPYYNANQALLVKSSSTLTCPSNVCTNATLVGLTVGLQTGTTSEGWAADNLNSSTTIQQFTTVDTEIAALEAGSIDAVIIDSAPATALAAGSSGAIKVAGTIITNELYGFAVGHGDPEHLLPIINSVLATAMQDGTYQKLVTKWFG